MSFVIVKSAPRKEGEPCPWCHSHDNRKIKGTLVKAGKSLKCPVCPFRARESRQKPIRYARVRKVHTKDVAESPFDTELSDAIAVLEKF